jgi:hypothetical protein
VDCFRRGIDSSAPEVKLSAKTLMSVETDYYYFTSTLVGSRIDTETGLFSQFGEPFQVFSSGDAIEHVLLQRLIFVL